MITANWLKFVSLLALLCSVHGFLGFSAFSNHKSLLFREPWTPNVLNRAESIITEEHITQRLDNFDPQNNATFRMVRILYFNPD